MKAYAGPDVRHVRATSVATGPSQVRALARGGGPQGRPSEFSPPGKCYLPVVSSSFGLEHSLRHHASDVLESWLLRFERSPIRLRRGLAAKTYTAQAANLLEALAVAVSGDPTELRAGSALSRELERSCAFLGAQFASSSASGFDVAAFLSTLRDAVHEFAPPDEAARIAEWFEWLMILALDAFATAGIQSLQERTTEQLESGTPVVQLAPKVAAVLLVGSPTPSTMDALLSRGLMLSISLSSNCLIVDCTGLSEPALPLFPKMFTAFIEREHPPSIEVLLVGAPRPICDACHDIMRRLTRRLTTVEHLDAAVAQVLDRNGYAIVRRS